MTDDAARAELLAVYQQALARDLAAPPPGALDPALAEIARRLAALPSGGEPDPGFVAALARQLAVAPTAVSVVPPAAERASAALTAIGGRSSVRPLAGHRAWRRARASLGVAASIAVLLIVAVLLALTLPRRDTSRRAPAQSPTGAGVLAVRPSATQRDPALTPSTTTTSCVGTLAPQQPATPPAKPFPATPTGREAELYIPCFFERDPGLARAEQMGLVQHLNLTQDGPGGTVTIERFYADANRVVVAYTLRAAVGQLDLAHMAPFRPTLSDSAGRAYPYMSPGAYEAFGGVNDGQRYTIAVISFDAAALPVDTRQETFRLTFDPLSTVNNTIPSGTFGPWKFDLTMPVSPARVAEVGQMVTSPVVVSYRQGEAGMAVARCNACPDLPAAGQAITVERVVATVSETRIYLRFTAPPVARQAGWEVRGIAVEDPTSPPVQQGGTTPLPDGRVVVTLVNPLDDKQGEWTVTIHELWALVPPDQAGDPRGFVQVRLTGDWTFRFVMP